MLTSKELWRLSSIPAMAQMASPAVAQEAAMAVTAANDLLDDYSCADSSSGRLRATGSPAMARNFGIEIGAHF